MGELSADDRAVHVLLGCVACLNEEKYGKAATKPHACCDSCGITYFSDGRYYQNRRKDCAKHNCEGEMYYPDR